ncbi:MAG: hypothetical protein J7507_10105 [Pseudoxanthomonas sp.]|nr:hypothetical protein [Pseudoxanthomonas sp.]
MTTARFPLRHACTLLLAALPALAAANPTTTAATAAQELEGAWRLVSGEFIDEQGQRTDYIAQHVEGIKVIDDAISPSPSPRPGSSGPVAAAPAKPMAVTMSNRPARRPSR